MTVVLLWFFFFSMQRYKPFFSFSFSVFDCFSSCICLCFVPLVPLYSLSPFSFFSLSFLSFWSLFSFHRPLFPSLYSVLFLSFVLQLFFSSLWFFLSSPFKCSPFCFLVFLFFQNLSLSSKLSYMFPVLFLCIFS
jgi:hypothetical protein